MIAAVAAIGCLVGMAVSVFVCTTIVRALLAQRYEMCSKSAAEWRHETRAELVQPIEEAKKLTIKVAGAYQSISKELKMLEERIVMIEKRLAAADEDDV